MVDCATLETGQRPGIVRTSAPVFVRPFDLACVPPQPIAGAARHPAMICAHRGVRGHLPLVTYLLTAMPACISSGQTGVSGASATSLTQRVSPLLK